MEGLLEAHQPEEQHGFRKHRWMDEHLLTATLFLDKAWDKGIPMWIVSLNLSKAFDRANWNALWLALRDHGVSDQLIWILQWIYSNQLGEVQGEHSNNNPFPIHAGVRQGCVLSPRFFFFPSHLFGRMKVHWYKAVLLGSFQAQTVFILASLQMCLR